MDNIPNGHKVPNPNSPGSYWEAVGHTTPDDGDGLNSFGEVRFDCQKDSECWPMDSLKHREAFLYNLLIFTGQVFSRCRSIGEEKWNISSHLIRVTCKR